MYLNYRSKREEKDDSEINIEIEDIHHDVIRKLDWTDWYDVLRIKYKDDNDENGWNPVSAAIYDHFPFIKAIRRNLPNYGCGVYEWRCQLWTSDLSTIASFDDIIYDGEYLVNSLVFYCGKAVNAKDQISKDIRLQDVSIFGLISKIIAFITFNKTFSSRFSIRFVSLESSHGWKKDAEKSIKTRLLNKYEYVCNNKNNNTQRINVGYQLLTRNTKSIPIANPDKDLFSEIVGDIDQDLNSDDESDSV